MEKQQPAEAPVTVIRWQATEIVRVYSGDPTAAEHELETAASDAILDARTLQELLEAIARRVAPRTITVTDASGPGSFPRVIDVRVEPAPSATDEGTS